MNSYELSRQWFDFAFENPHKINPHHSAIYFFAIERCNRLGWKTIFGFPTSTVLEVIGMKSYGSYKKYFDDLVKWGFIKVHEYSKNQHSSNIIELTLNVKAGTKALDKALIGHAIKQDESTSESIDSINKQINKEQLNNITTEPRNFVLEIINNEHLIFEPLKMKHSKLKDLDLAIEQYSLAEMSNPKPREVATTIYFALDKWLNSWSTNNFGKKKDEPHPDWNGGNTPSGITL
jgi:hypothetical protein